MLRYIQPLFHVLCALALLVLISAGALAGSQEKRCDHGEHKMHQQYGKHGKGGMLERAVELTDEQKVAYDEIRNKYKDDLKSLRKQKHETHKALMELDPQDKAFDKKLKKLASENAKMAEKQTLIHGKKHAEVMALLTQEQKQSLSQYRNEMRAKKEMHKQHGKQEKMQTQ